MTTYTIRSKSGAGNEVGRVRATGPEQAASIYARRRNRRHVARRVTGTAGLSGVFQAYREIESGRAMTSVGDPFHVG